ncbi:HAD-IIB family hydrolase [Ectothiorhodospiraceae bacterium BW-2]|nr:HAD-IIB family hydrolase [Ectothiorhodospiraceae bacterium BW-2]
MKYEQNDGLYLLQISIHGLIRRENLELGRDADTGGQIKYVIELASELGHHSAIARLDLITRQLQDETIAADYAEPFEQLSPRAQIVRIPCGDNRYIVKEQLWDYLDNFADNLLDYLSEQPRLPDLIHSHYADAGYVATRLSHQLGIPLVHTGHSLGRSKRKRLLATGLNSDTLEQRYNISRRIEAEEQTLGSADRIITSTYQEIEEQYGLYDYYQPDRMRVVPPGTDLSRFYPPDGSETDSHLLAMLGHFLRQPEKPPILAISRPDQRKNIITLIEAYGESLALQQQANLIIIAGNRDDIRELESGAQEVLTDILLTIDLYDLYGKVAYPKHHSSDDIPLFYRLAAKLGGIFINPALTEPFGLTLIEAAACGLPIIATEDGGPVDIIGNCHNGFLIDPLSHDDISQKCLQLLQHQELWEQMAHNGAQGVARHYSWSAHVTRYLEVIRPVIDKSEPVIQSRPQRRQMLYHDRAIFSDIDQSLIGEPKALRQFIQLLQQNRLCTTFGIATGRRLDSALKLFRQEGLPQPDILITSLGTEIYYAPNLTRDTAWSDHINHLWDRKRLLRLMTDIEGISLQPKREQSPFKLSYFIDPDIAPSVNDIYHYLLQNDQSVNLVMSFGMYLDLLPARASKGQALRWVARQWEIPLDHILTAGGSGADEDMMRGNTLAVVVANRHHEELSELADVERIYFATQKCAAGIIEAIEHYHFFDLCRLNHNPPSKSPDNV